MGRTMTAPRFLGFAVIVLIAIMAGQLANSLFGNVLFGLVAATIVGTFGFIAMQTRAGWLRVVGITLLTSVVAGMAYVAFVFWWNYG